MHHHLLSSSITMAPPSSSSSLSKPPKKPSNPNFPNCSSSSLCNHSPSATLDLLIFVLVLFSGTFLIISYFSYIFNSLSLLFPYPLTLNVDVLTTQYIFYAFFFVVFFVVVISFEICCGFFGFFRSRKCGKPGCKGLRRAMEFDLQLQGEECFLRSGGADSSSSSKAVREINELPWKGGSENNPDYECLRAELRKMAPPNGRAVLLFRSKCGCPVAKLEGWGAKRGRRHKKTLALNGKADNR
ncbi:uncharacterized protein At5g19025-like isoform X1 [Nicotiana sylvestris]|uniref:Uncharacterized protein At5g19025-like n=1 Tax=Nicotiana sylvestris TaxID=4096 RepID=A0A1U7WD65_NICSY|nr:PREDICTED: uncharacterized protein At5g19025-like [Nicotiana sylvestris]